MITYFSRKSYQTPIVRKEVYEAWKQENPKFKKVTYAQFKAEWRKFVDDLCQEIIKNPSGVDLYNNIGNFSIKILDINFKCEKDFLLVKKGKLHKLTPVITTDSPKKGKITWKKAINTPGVAKFMGFEAASKFKKVIARNLKGNENLYEKAFSFDKTPSKCMDEEEKSLFDLL